MLRIRGGGSSLEVKTILNIRSKLFPKVKTILNSCYFRDLNERNVNLYSTCVFWLLDNTYAQNILYNFSNYSIDDVQDFLKEVPMSDLFPCTNICRDAVFTMITSIPERKEKMTSLKMMWDSGDLSFAPDPNSYDYIHRSKDNINLSLSVINQMTVSIDLF